MKQSLPLMTLVLACISNTVFAACDYTPDQEGFKVHFTFYGAPDKSYVVTKNTFTEYETASETGKLVGATIDIDATSVDTSHDLSNGMGGQWPANFVPIRNMNVVNGLFNNYVNPGKVAAKIASVDAEKVNVEVTMNGETRTIPMDYSIAEGVLSAAGKLDILDFNAAEAFAKFEALCKVAWHKGKSWSEIEIFFEVPVAETGC